MLSLGKFFTFFLESSETCYYFLSSVCRVNHIIDVDTPGGQDDTDERADRQHNQHEAALGTLF